MKKILFLMACFSLSEQKAQAKIYFDHEPEPIPVVEIQVVIPGGFVGRQSGVESASLMALSELMEYGTTKLGREQFLDRLAKFGADFSFSVGREYSYWTLTFPWVSGTSYASLTEILKENWSKPRLGGKELRTVKVKLQASMRSELDNDQAIVSNNTRRIFLRSVLGGEPAYMEDVQLLSETTVSNAFYQLLQKSPDVWAGFTGPNEAKPFVEHLLRSVFSGQGELEKTPLQTMLANVPFQKTRAPKTEMGSKNFYIFDKSERTQNVFLSMAFAPQETPSADGALNRELSQLLGAHVLVNNGLGSILPEEIRSKRGLAYAVMGVDGRYLSFDTLGFGANPQSSRIEEALKVFKEATEKSYVSGEYLTKLDSERWYNDFRSFKYERILSRSTAMGRLAARKEVVVGDSSYELYASNPAEWSLSKEDVAAQLKMQWSKSTVLSAIVGDADKLKPLIQQEFPEFKVQVIPYKSLISRHVSYQ